MNRSYERERRYTSHLFKKEKYNKNRSLRNQSSEYKSPM